MISSPAVRSITLAAVLGCGCGELPSGGSTSELGGTSTGGTAAAGLGGSGGSGTGGASAAGSAGSASGSVAMSGAGGSGGATGGNAGAGGLAGASAGAGGAPVFEGSGSITYERWNDIPGETVSLVPVNEPPDVTMALLEFQAPDDVGQDFAARMHGILTAPMTGDYTFWVSSDDNSELNLSSDETPQNKQRIAHVTGSPAWTDYVEWNKFPTQKSAAIPLVAGQRYYIEALLKEDIAEDHLAVGWLKPGESATEPSEIIPGKQLSPIE